MNNIKNSIQGLEEGSIGQRLVYAVFLILGIFFFVASLSTMYQVVLLFQIDNYTSVGISKLISTFIYVLLNFIVGYGLVFCRKWIISLFLTNVVCMGFIALWIQLFHPHVQPGSSLPALGIAVLMSVFLLITQKYLSGDMFKKNVYIVYTVALLVTLSISYVF